MMRDGDGEPNGTIEETGKILAYIFSFSFLKYFTEI